MLPASASSAGVHASLLTRLPTWDRDNSVTVPFVLSIEAKRGSPGSLEASALTYRSIASRSAERPGPPFSPSRIEWMSQVCGESERRVLVSFCASALRRCASWRLRVRMFSR